MDNASPPEQNRNIIIEPLGLEGMLGLPESWPYTGGYRRLYCNLIRRRCD